LKRVAVQAVGECERQPLERIVFVMRRDREAVEIGQRVIHPYKAQLRIAQAQADGDVPDRVEEAPGRCLLGSRRAGGEGARAVT
jgi:hypothetical protein